MPASTRLFLFPDINVWISLTYERHFHHVRAMDWFGSLEDGARLFFCRITQLGLLRLLTTEAVMGKEEVMGQKEAWMCYDRWLEDSRVSFLPEPPTLTEIDHTFRRMSRLPHPAPKDWADSYLAAFAEASELAIVTFDRALHAKANRSIFLN